MNKNNEAKKRVIALVDGVIAELEKNLESKKQELCKLRDDMLGVETPSDCVELISGVFAPEFRGRYDCDQLKKLDEAVNVLAHSFKGSHE